MRRNHRRIWCCHVSKIRVYPCTAHAFAISHTVIDDVRAAIPSCDRSSLSGAPCIDVEGDDQRTQLIQPQDAAAFVMRAAVEKRNWRLHIIMSSLTLTDDRSAQSQLLSNAYLECLICPHDIASICDTWEGLGVHQLSKLSCQELRLPQFTRAEAI